VGLSFAQFEEALDDETQRPDGGRAAHLFFDLARQRFRAGFMKFDTTARQRPRRIGNSTMDHKDARCTISVRRPGTGSGTNLHP
jgi:hypothetical protein